jgi:acetyl esterase/lipase
VPTSGGPTWPAVLVIHIGGFKTGSAYDGGPEIAAADLQAKGYLALIVTYRLAPCGLIVGQHCHDSTTDGIASGRPPQQTDDIKTLVRAARVDPQGNGRVGIVGGSAGGSHAAFVALDVRTINDWTHWSASQRPDAVACLSGAYDLSDRDDVTNQFKSNVENYTNTCVRVDTDPNKPDQKKVSPVARVTTPTSEVPFIPMFLINSDGDSMPPHQIVAMQCALINAMVDPNLYRVLTLVDNDKHAFAYWGDFDGVRPQRHRVKEDVLEFLDQYLKP